MASKNERARWESWYEQVDERMTRQKKSLDRLVLLLTEASAALLEIQAMTYEQAVAFDGRLDNIHKRASEALDRIKEPAAAALAEIEESARTDEPISDPRRGK